MNTPSDSSAEAVILVSLLRFFSLQSGEQIKKLTEYRNLAASRGQQVHVHTPVIELAEGLESLCDKSESIVKQNTNGRQMLIEIGSLLNLILYCNALEFASEESLRDKPYWQVIRRLCSEALSKLGAFHYADGLSVWDMLSMVSD